MIAHGDASTIAYFILRQFSFSFAVFSAWGGLGIYCRWRLAPALSFMWYSAISRIQLSSPDTIFNRCPSGARLQHAVEHFGTPHCVEVFLPTAGFKSGRGDNSNVDSHAVSRVARRRPSAPSFVWGPNRLVTSGTLSLKWEFILDFPMLPRDTVINSAATKANIWQRTMKTLLLHALLQIQIQ